MIFLLLMIVLIIALLFTAIVYHKTKTILFKMGHPAAGKRSLQSAIQHFERIFRIRTLDDLGTGRIYHRIQG